MQTTATPTPDGNGYILNGQKRWITNGGIAQVLTVMARTPVPGSKETKITAFLVTPDMPGFEVVEKRMAKCGVRGTATARLAFHDMFVPKENILGQLGKGLRVALTVLDFGRTTFGASCTGAAKFCVERATKHALQRVQFGQPLANFELVKDKLAYMPAGAFAMEAATYQTAALIDSGEGDYMLETAMLKVFATDVLWRIINDTIQIFGGKAYFTDEPYERMMRDARINMIGEGANDVLRVFTALVGMRDVGLELKGVLDAAKSPLQKSRQAQRLRRPQDRSRSSARRPSTCTMPSWSPTPCGWASWSARSARRSKRCCGTIRESILDRQYQLARIADARTNCTSAPACCDGSTRCWARARSTRARKLELETGRYYLLTAERRIHHNLDNLWVERRRGDRSPGRFVAGEVSAIGDLVSRRAAGGHSFPPSAWPSRADARALALLAASPARRLPVWVLQSGQC